MVHGIGAQAVPKEGPKRKPGRPRKVPVETPTLTAEATKPQVAVDKPEHVVIGTTRQKPSPPQARPSSISVMTRSPAPLEVDVSTLQEHDNPVLGGEPPVKAVSSPSGYSSDHESDRCACMVFAIIAEPMRGVFL
jgi:hypothetical protein